MKLLPQLIVQAMLWLSLGLVLVGLPRRRGPRAAAETSVGVLVGLAGLTVLGLLPWPAWYSWPAGQPIVAEIVAATPAAPTLPEATPVTRGDPHRHSKNQ